MSTAPESHPVVDDVVGTVAGSLDPARWRLVEAPQPASLDAPDAWAYHAVADIDREQHLEIYGYDDLALEARDVLSGMQHQEYEAKRRFVILAAREPAGEPEVPDVVAHLFVCRSTSSNTHLGESYASVRPAARGQGLGSALMDLGEGLCRADGRTVLFTATQHATEVPAGPGAVEATTGAGRVPADEPGPRFVARRGYVLEQVERHSTLDLPVEPELLARLGRDARAAAGDGYRTHTWTDEVPDRWLDEVGVLFTRMSTDAPVGGVDYREDPWDAERVRTWLTEERGKDHGVLTTAVEHVGSGTLAGFTVITYPEDRPGFAFQDDTIVLTEHRGHRLGMLVKVVNLEALARLRPATQRIHTWNAEENAHMLAINVALGFAPAGGWDAWQRKLTPGADA
ncbi:GNAT family N-acetyltransferase [Oerskovia flava]|uniref:GNAT family N-acetyltransferase n=1 Tax=Oerskovia flava TaxID=2986422 RepID=UPI00223F8DBA|nr:GNAT family N-acetyltransferase [Oerskovia sp. JB1-3-2]